MLFRLFQPSFCALLFFLLFLLFSTSFAYAQADSGSEKGVTTPENASDSRSGAPEEVGEGMQELELEPPYPDQPYEIIEEESRIDSALVDGFEAGFEVFVGWMEAVLFYEIVGFPAVVLWLIVGCVFFTLRLGFVNIRLFGHALKVVRGTYSSPDDPGEVTHFQALSAAVSATVGLGNIAGVAVAVSLGGPGAVIWMMIAGFFGMSMKFSEVTMGHKFRHIDEHGKVRAGAFYYLEEGLRELNWPRFGKFLAIVFAICCLCGSLGGGNMFQSNQSVAMMTNTFGSISDLDWLIALVLAVGVGFVLIGGIKRIANVAEAIVPLMALIYVTACLVVLVSNAEFVPTALGTMISEAFDWQAAGGGMIGALIMGFRRAAFSNEAGVGSAPIAHAAAKTKEPVREGCVALLEPFIDTMVICLMTGIVITVTGVYADETINADGARLTSAAFATVVDWFPVVLSICIILFAYSTMITWSYYGENAWVYMFGPKRIGIYHVIFCTATFVGGVINFGVVLTFSDLMILMMAVPNILGLYFLQGILRREVKSYMQRLKAGEFVEHKAHLKDMIGN